MQQIEPGNRVAYSVQFLRSVGESHGDMAAGRGTVSAVKELGGGITLATVQWDRHDLPGRVNVKNLARIGANRQFCNVD